MINATVRLTGISQHIMSEYNFLKIQSKLNTDIKVEGIWFSDEGIAHVAVSTGDDSCTTIFPDNHPTGTLTLGEKEYDLRELFGNNEH